jgi:hypothetical protein
LFLFVYVLIFAHLYPVCAIPVLPILRVCAFVYHCLRLSLFVGLCAFAPHFVRLLFVDHLLVHPFAFMPFIPSHLSIGLSLRVPGSLRRHSALPAGRFRAAAREAKWKRLNVLRWGIDRHNNVIFAPENDGQARSELFDVAHSTKRMRPWRERRQSSSAALPPMKRANRRPEPTRTVRRAETSDLMSLAKTNP